MAGMADEEYVADEWKTDVRHLALLESGGPAPALGPARAGALGGDVADCEIE